MSILIVDEFEGVKIEIADGHEAAGTLGSGARLLSSVEQEPSVRERGELVVVRDPIQLCLVGLELVAASIIIAVGPLGSPDLSGPWGGGLQSAVKTRTGD